MITLVFRFSFTENGPRLNKKMQGKDSKKIVRRFRKSNTVKEILSFLRSQENFPCPSAFELVRAYPTLSLSAPEIRELSIEALGLQNNSSLTVRSV